MKYKSYPDLVDLLKRYYEAVDKQHSSGDEFNHFEFGMGDWANPIDIGEHSSIPARRLAEPPADAYIFMRSFDELGLGYFVVKLGEQVIEVERITHAKALALEAAD